MSILTAIEFSARRREVERAECTLKYMSTRNERQQSRKLKCEEYMASQTGIAYIRQTALLLVVSFLVLLGYRLVPVYFEYLTVKNVILAMESIPDLDEKSERKWTAELQKQFDINNISRLKARDLDIEKEDSRVTVEVQYEVRENLLFNIDLLVSFDEKFALPFHEDEHESS